MRGLRWIAFATIALIGAAAAQPITPPQLRVPGLQAPRLIVTDRFTSATANVSDCRTSPASGVTVTVRAVITLPDAATETSVAFQIVEGDTVRASGNAAVVRVRRPDGRLAGSVTVPIEATFDRDGFGGSGSVYLRASAVSANSPAMAYNWGCLTAMPGPGARASTTLALPDLAFSERLTSFAMYRPNNEGASEGALVRSGVPMVLWDTGFCRGHNSNWSIVNVRPVLVNLGNAATPPQVLLEARVSQAPSLTDNNRQRYNLVHNESDRRFIETNVGGARVATGGNLDVVLRQQIGAASFNARDATAMRPFNNMDIALPCGPGRSLTLILDPDNLIRESNEDNNRIVIGYDLLG